MYQDYLINKQIQFVARCNDILADSKYARMRLFEIDNAPFTEF